MDQEIEREPVTADPGDSPDQPDHRRDQDGYRYRDPQQDPAVMPRKAELVNLTEIDDPNVR